jgi:hypothetical protein
MQEPKTDSAPLIELFSLLQECPPLGWSPHVSTFVEQFERSFGSIRARPVSGLVLDQLEPTLGVWKRPWSLQ